MHYPFSYKKMAPPNDQKPPADFFPALEEEEETKAMDEEEEEEEEETTDDNEEEDTMDDEESSEEDDSWSCAHEEVKDDLEHAIRQVWRHNRRTDIREIFLHFFQVVVNNLHF